MNKSDLLIVVNANAERPVCFSAVFDGNKEDVDTIVKEALEGIDPEIDDEEFANLLNGLHTDHLYWLGDYAFEWIEHE